ncbi:dTDP-4-dehydrorhamnose 3,5-epimerase [Leptospira sp. 96542]|nr:dTDP-4-dehydrorhamnose 3,5-epimerase [Leptospira sp. 96542]
MKTKTFSIDGPVLIFPQVHGDDRGFFLESFKASQYKEFGIPELFKQDNHSKSNKNVLRGLHFQAPPMEQGKLVRVVKGSVLDVAVDIRKNSVTYGQHVSVTLTEKNHEIFWVPPGFAHGFLTLEDNTEFLYKVTNEYSKETEGGILFNDPHLDINWGISEKDCILSEKDRVLPSFANFSNPF